MNKSKDLLSIILFMMTLLLLAGCSVESRALWQVRHSPNPEKRMQAVKKLGEIGNEEAVSALIEALGDKDVRVSITSMEELSDLEVKAIDALVGALKHESFQVRRRAIQALGRMYGEVFRLIYEHKRFDLLSGKEAYVDRVGVGLIEKLADADYCIRKAACDLLFKWNWWWKPDSTAVQPLIRAYAAVASESFTQSPPVIVDPMSEAVYRTPHERRRARYRVIVDLMMETADLRLVPCLIDALSSDYRSVESSAITGLGRIGGEQATRAIISVLDDSSSLSHYQAVNALAKIGNSAAVQRLLDALYDESERIRSYSAGTLGHVDDPRVLPALLEALDDDSVHVRASAAYSLGQTGDLRAFKPLRRAMYDDSSIVRESAIRALGWPGDGRAFQPLISISTLSHRKPGMRIAAAGALGELGDPRAVPYLEILLADEYMEVRHAAAHALWKITGKSYEVSEQGARRLPNICSH
ncbi:hypothetical protein ES703_25796 [subsurface metagenome]|nr:hypothetical protein [bacterium]